MDSVPFCKHATHKSAPGVNCSSSNTGKCLFFQMLQTRHLRPGFVKGGPRHSAVEGFCQSLCTQCCWGILPVPLHSVLLEDYACFFALSSVGGFCLSLCTQFCWRILPVPLHSVLLGHSAGPFALSAVGGFCLSQCTQCCWKILPVPLHLFSSWKSAEFCTALSDLEQGPECLCKINKQGYIGTHKTSHKCNNKDPIVYSHSCLAC